MSRPRVHSLIAVAVFGVLSGLGQASRAEFMTFTTVVNVVDLSGSGMTVDGDGTDFVTISAGGDNRVELTGLADLTVTRVGDLDRIFRFGGIQTFNDAHAGHEDYDFAVVFTTTITDYARRGGGAGSGYLGQQDVVFALEYAGRARADGGFRLHFIGGLGSFGLLTFPGDPTTYVIDGASVPDPANKNFKRLAFSMRAITVPEPGTCGMTVLGGLILATGSFRRRKRHAVL